MSRICQRLVLEVLEEEPATRHTVKELRQAVAAKRGWAPENHSLVAIYDALWFLAADKKVVKHEGSPTTFSRL